jgi:hypothetical protein
MAMPSEALRASPSMPVFPTMEHNHRLDSLETGLPNITEEREDPLKLPDSVTSMFLDEHEQAGSDDLLSLMKDLTDQGANVGLDLDLNMPLGDAPRVSESSPHVAENAQAASRTWQDGSAAMGTGQPPEAQHAGQASDIDPSFFHVDGADHIGMAMLDDVDDFSSPYLDL